MRKYKISNLHEEMDINAITSALQKNQDEVTMKAAIELVEKLSSNQLEVDELIGILKLILRLNEICLLGSTNGEISIRIWKKILILLKNNGPQLSLLPLNVARDTLDALITYANHGLEVLTSMEVCIETLKPCRQSVQVQYYFCQRIGAVVSFLASILPQNEIVKGISALLTFLGVLFTLTGVANQLEIADIPPQTFELVRKTLKALQSNNRNVDTRDLVLCATHVGSTATPAHKPCYLLVGAIVLVTEEIAIVAATGAGDGCTTGGGGDCKTRGLHLDYVCGRVELAMEAIGALNATHTGAVDDTCVERMLTRCIAGVVQVLRTSGREQRRALEVGDGASPL